MFGLLLEFFLSFLDFIGEEFAEIFDFFFVTKKSINTRFPHKMHYGAPHVNVYLCNPGPYQVKLNININQTHRAGVQYNFHPEVGMYPYQQQQQLHQQQYPAINYGPAPHYQALPAPLQNFPRTESTASFMPDSSYSSNLSTPGIVSESWSYNSPHRSIMSPTGFNPANKATYKDYKNRPFDASRLTSDQSYSHFNPASGNTKHPSTSTPNKPGCFSLANCTVA